MNTFVGGRTYYLIGSHNSSSALAGLGQPPKHKTSPYLSPSIIGNQQLPGYFRQTRLLTAPLPGKEKQMNRCRQRHIAFSYGAVRGPSTLLNRRQDQLGGLLRSDITDK